MSKSEFPTNPTRDEKNKGTALEILKEEVATLNRRLSKIMGSGADTMRQEHMSRIREMVISLHTIKQNEGETSESYLKLLTQYREFIEQQIQILEPSSDRNDELHAPTYKEIVETMETVGWVRVEPEAFDNLVQLLTDFSAVAEIDTTDAQEEKVRIFFIKNVISPDKLPTKLPATPNGAVIGGSLQQYISQEMHSLSYRKQNDGGLIERSLTPIQQNEEHKWVAKTPSEQFNKELPVLTADHWFQIDRQLESFIESGRLPPEYGKGFITVKQVDYADGVTRTFAKITGDGPATLPEGAKGRSLTYHIQHISRQEGDALQHAEVAVRIPERLIPEVNDKTALETELFDRKWRKVDKETHDSIQDGITMRGVNSEFLTTLDITHEGTGEHMYFLLPSGVPSDSLPTLPSGYAAETHMYATQLRYDKNGGAFHFTEISIAFDEKGNPQIAPVSEKKDAEAFAIERSMNERSWRNISREVLENWRSRPADTIRADSFSLASVAPVNKENERQFFYSDVQQDFYPALPDNVRADVVFYEKRKNEKNELEIKPISASVMHPEIHEGKLTRAHDPTKVLQRITQPSVIPTLPTEEKHQPEDLVVPQEEKEEKIVPVPSRPTRKPSFTERAKRKLLRAAVWLGLGVLTVPSEGSSERDSYTPPPMKPGVASPAQPQPDFGIPTTTKDAELPAGVQSKTSSPKTSSSTHDSGVMQKDTPVKVDMPVPDVNTELPDAAVDMSTSQEDAESLPIPPEVDTPLPEKTLPPATILEKEVQVTQDLQVTVDPGKGVIHTVRKGLRELGLSSSEMNTQLDALKKANKTEWYAATVHPGDKIELEYSTDGERKIVTDVTIRPLTKVERLKSQFPEPSAETERSREHSDDTFSITRTADDGESMSHDFGIGSFMNYTTASGKEKRVRIISPSKDKEGGVICRDDSGRQFAVKAIDRFSPAPEYKDMRGYVGVDVKKIEHGQFELTLTGGQGLLKAVETLLVNHLDYDIPTAKLMIRIMAAEIGTKGVIANDGEIYRQLPDTIPKGTTLTVQMNGDSAKPRVSAVGLGL